MKSKIYRKASLSLQSELKKTHQLATGIIQESTVSITKKQKISIENFSKQPSSNQINQLIFVHNLFCQLVQSDQFFCATFDFFGRVLDVSENIQIITGFFPNEVVGKESKNFLHPDDLFFVEEWVTYSPKKKSGKALFIRCLTKTGKWIWMKCFGFCLRTMGKIEFYFFGTPIEPFEIKKALS